MRSVIGSAAVTLVLAASSFSAARFVNPANPLAAHRAKAVFEAKSGSTVSGEATFTEKKDGVEISIKIKGATAGLHGIHLHEKGDCSAADAASAGGHFNPDKSTHGAPDGAPHHGGDLGNITIRANGSGELKLTVKGLTVSEGEHSVVGRAFVVHAGADDLKSQPAGNSGSRVACGVIKAAN